VQRLATRLALAMILVATVSLSVAVVSQVLIAREASARLPAEVRQRMVELRGDGRMFEWVFRGRPVPPRMAGDAFTLTVTDSIRAIDRVQSAQWRGLVYGLALAVIASGALAWWLARGIARPIAAVGAAASRVGSGDLEARVAPTDSTFGAATEVDELTEGFNRMAETLERNERERKALVADVAHELRTPITAMTLRLEALRDGLVPFEAVEVERLARQTALLHRLVEDLRTLSLADAGRLTLRRDPVDVVQLVRDACEAFAPLARPKGVSVALVAADDPATTITGDADRLRQVLTNLLDNALRASPEGGAITLELAPQPGGVIVTVRDEGPGFTDADLPHVFERFRQGEEGRRDLRGHTGLGLAIVRALVGLHGGDVAARNSAGGGAEVSVRLPGA
jgi:two-component system, OmpR family, sensor histidine kinase BaeS